jgi:DNA-binding NarL/FixJ family response regulator
MQPVESGSIQPALWDETKELIEKNRRLREQGRLLRQELSMHIARLSNWGKPGVESPAGAPQNPDTLLAQLSKRERLVLTLIARSYSTKQIAGMLGISFKTAESHRTRLMAKLDVHDVAALTRLAIRAGLIGP